MMEDFITGIVTSVIGGALLGAMRPGHVSFQSVAGDLLLWLVIVVLSVIVGILVAVVFFHTAGPTVINGILYRSVKDARASPPASVSARLPGRVHKGPEVQGGLT